MEGKKLIRRSREENLNFDLYEVESGVEEVYVDGSTATALSPSVAKIEFYTTAAPDESDPKVEKRILKLRLIMPTSTWVELCAKALLSVSENRETILPFFDADKKKLVDFLGFVARSGQGPE